MTERLLRLCQHLASTYQTCPFCGGGDGHAQDCALAEALQAQRAPTLLERVVARLHAMGLRVTTRQVAKSSNTIIHVFVDPEPEPVVSLFSPNNNSILGYATEDAVVAFVKSRALFNLKERLPGMRSAILKAQEAYEASLAAFKTTHAAYENICGIAEETP